MDTVSGHSVVRTLSQSRYWLYDEPFGYQLTSRNSAAGYGSLDVVDGNLQKAVLFHEGPFSFPGCCDTNMLPDLLSASNRLVSEAAPVYSKKYCGRPSVSSRGCYWYSSRSFPLIALEVAYYNVEGSTRNMELLSHINLGKSKHRNLVF